MIVKRDMYYWPADSIRTLHIWLPDNYYHCDERYPVMYFFDGHNLFYDYDATFGKCWGLKEFMEGWGKDMIIVGMECSHDGDARLGEYSPYDKSWGKKRIPGIGRKTFDWIIGTVKPVIDRDYRTWPHRAATGIGGSSMGGLMSIFGVIEYNHIFSKAACVSPGIFYNIQHLRKDLEYADINPDTRIFISWGEKEAGRAPHDGDPAKDTREARSVYKFEKQLQARGARTYIFFQRDGRHCEADWEKQIPYFMNFLWLSD
ncbi:MAG: alpha/beta hydrolase [Solobacterium sp.]|nr:alpha/beta hydrolase [Solobacterium sp.]